MRVKSFFLSVLLAANFVAAPVFAEEPGPFLLRVSTDVLDLVKDARGLKEGAEDKLRKDLKTYLDQYVDFGAFSQGVLGKYREEASPMQAKDFSENFKDTMVRLYSKAMLAFDVKSMTLASAMEPKPGVAQVTMLITSGEGATFSAQYSLRKDVTNNVWKVRNVILDGVNLGLTYRNQFYSAVDSQKGDVVAAMAGWSALQNGTPVIAGQTVAENR